MNLQKHGLGVCLALLIVGGANASAERASANTATQATTESGSAELKSSSEPASSPEDLANASCGLPAAGDSSSTAEKTVGVKGYTAGGKTYYEADLPKVYAEQMYQVELEAYRKKQRVFTEHFMMSHFEELAKSQGVSVGEVQEKVLGAAVPKEKDIKEFYNSHKAQLPQRGYDELKEEIKRHLTSQGMAKAREELLEDLVKKKKFSVLGLPPTPPIFNVSFPEAPVKGPDHAQVNIVKFSDFYCGYCKMASEQLKKVMAMHPKKISVTYVSYGTHGELSDYLSQGAFCAAQQGKFWEFHDQAFELGGESLKKESGSEIAGKLKLDMKKFAACLSGPESAAYVKKAKDFGDSLRVRATPTLFVNGVRANLSSLEADVADALAKK